METEHNYWLHRITGGENASSLGSALYEKDWLSIGWSYLSSGENLDKIRSSWPVFESLFDDNYRPRNRHNLWRFCVGMKPGDTVVVPLPYSFSVCEILDNEVLTVSELPEDLLVDKEGRKVKLCDDGRLHYVVNDSEGVYIDLGFFRRVSVKERSIPREKYASPALQRRMKIQQTNTGINDLRKDVEDAIRHFKENKPVNLKAVILDETVGTVHKLITESLNDRQFERLVEWYLRSIGADRVEKGDKSGGGEGDADRVAYFYKTGLVIMVQVKEHEIKTETSDWAVSQIMSYSDSHNFKDSSTALWVISNADKFSENAMRLAEEHNVRLIDGTSFARMILETGVGSFEI